jgi:hypothetical protein
MKTTNTLTPPVRRAGPQKKHDDAELAQRATIYFARMLNQQPQHLRGLFKKSVFDLQNRSCFAVTCRQALIYVLGCNGFSHKAAGNCLRMNESTCVYIFRRAGQRYIDDVKFRELCNFIAGIEQTTETQTAANAISKR